MLYRAGRPHAAETDRPLIRSTRLFEMGTYVEASAEKCRIIGIRPIGEWVEISRHQSCQKAKRTVKLILHGSDFTSIEIEQINAASGD